MQVSTRPDPSDAGMAWFLATGDEEADPAGLKRLLDDHVRPQPVAARRRIRLEAENFRELTGFEVEDTNDRAASHRLQVKLSGRAAGRITTRLAEPYAAARGRYDVEVRFRYLNPSAGCRLELSVAGSGAGKAWESSGQEAAWQTHTIRGVSIRSGDEIAVSANSAGVRIDYVQLNLVGAANAAP
jgi:hypothetical protein